MNLVLIGGAIGGIGLYSFRDKKLDCRDELSLGDYITLDTAASLLKTGLRTKARFTSADEEGRQMKLHEMGLLDFNGPIVETMHGNDPLPAITNPGRGALIDLFLRYPLTLQESLVLYFRRSYVFRPFAHLLQNWLFTHWPPAYGPELFEVMTVIREDSAYAVFLPVSELSKAGTR